MKNSKITGKKSVFLALAAAAAFSGVSANASAQGMIASYNLPVKNNTSGCVRVYAGSAKNLAPNAWGNIGVQSSKWYMASIYRYGCGGTAIRNAWFYASGDTRAVWWIN